MMKILLTNGEVKAGAIKLPGRKLPSICIQKDGELILLGHFYSMKSAEMFMDAVGELVGKK